MTCILASLTFCALDPRNRRSPRCMRRGLLLYSLCGHVRSASAMSALGQRRSITFVTGNAKKLEEVTAILSAGDSGALPFAITNTALDLPELQGEPNDIATEKCVMAAAAAKGPVMCEDTLLCFNALGGLPGPRVPPAFSRKRFGPRARRRALVGTSSGSCRRRATRD